MDEWQLFWTGADVVAPASEAGVLDGWEGLAARESQLGIRTGQPILLSPAGRVDPRLSRIFKSHYFARKSEGTRQTYAPCYRVFFTFLWQRGLNWDEATPEDLEDWEDWRLRGLGNRNTITGSTWGKELAALRLLYDIARKLRFVADSPVLLRSFVLPDGTMVESAELAPADVRGSDVKWLTPRAYRLWRDVGLGGLLSDGLENPSWPGRNDARDTSYADLVYSSGLRRREGGTLLLAELPELTDRRYYAGKVGTAVAKRAGRTFYASHGALRTVEYYRLSTRAQAVRRAQMRGLYEQVPDKRILEEVTRRRIARWSEPDGRLGQAHLDKLNVRQRMKLFVRAADGLEPAMVWLTESGMPMAYRSWTKTFERASERCAAMGLTVFATPHMLRHSMALRMLLALNHALDRRLGLTPGERRRYEEAYGTVWSMVKDLLGHLSEETTKAIYLEPVRGLQLETLLNDEDHPVNDLMLSELARRTGLILDAV
ncbi:site-specific integrase [Streptomyces virginiae]|uniref:site-specific integrase n=1 Tax=Streptomyces TaxID=1883 RepID=UPI00068ADAD6|nr:MULTISPECIES: site-specific integrase [Streptomyces]MCX4718184.1 site-specific integrase [Streptomyces virginiae]WSR18747.1 site-specific integrase [Streptomyces sp. NBC_01207]WSX97025.1 site-specific integrase [Streptomyces goshikiensis]